MDLERAGFACKIAKRLAPTRAKIRINSRRAIRSGSAWGLAAGIIAGTIPLPHAVAATLSPGVPNSQPTVEPEKIASYTIQASLDPRTHTITGHEVVHWKNPSALSTNAIYLHAYLNAFRNNQTRFMRDATSSRRSRTNLSFPGQLRIKSVIAEQFGRVDLWSTRAPHSPDDPLDETDIRLPLPEPLEGHGSLTLEIAFEAQLPELVERAGYVDSFHALAQWFPKLARRTTGGQDRHFAYSPLAEFSADFGDYDVTLEVPEAFTIAAPGIRQSLHIAHAKRTERYYLTNAHDFAWFAWDKFIVREERVGLVDVRHYSYEDQGSNRNLTLRTLRWAIPELTRAFSPFPYSTLVVVHPPDQAAASGGMEYPGLIVTGGPWYLCASGFRFIESLTVHELVHQWFYGMVASDEYLHPVLDEGITAYVESWALNKRFGLGSMFDSHVFQLSESPLREASARQYSQRGPLGRPAASFGDFPSLSGQVYARTATLLDTLGRVYGTERLIFALGQYARKYRYRHPEPEDFLRVMQAELGLREATALRTAFFENAWVDNAVVSLEAFPGNLAQIGVERRGTLDFPVELEVVLKDGQVLRRHLDSLPRKGLIEWSTPSPVVAVTLDPDVRISIDDNLGNQTLRVAAKKPPLHLYATVQQLVTSLLGLVLP